MNKRLITFIRIAFYLLIILFLSNISEVLYIKDDFIQIVIIALTTILTISLLVIEIINKSNFLKIIQPLMVVALLIWLNPMVLLFQSGSWKTQTIKFIDDNNPRHVVEEQMKDIGALGYASREVEVFYILKRKVFFNLGEYDHRNFLGYNWRKVNEELNEMELK